MKKRTAIFLTVFALWPFLTAMSALQGQSPEKIPTPAKKFVATFIDGFVKSHAAILTV